MRQRSSIALGLAWAAALTLVVPSALAATPQKKKPARASAGKKGKKVEVEAPPPPPEPPPVEPPEAPPADVKPDAEKPSAPAPVELTLSKPELAPVTDEEAALGRREARRIAAGRSLVAVWVAGGVANRRFAYNDAVGYDLADYRLPVAPMATVGVEAYPAASSDVPVLRDLG